MQHITLLSYYIDMTVQINDRDISQMNWEYSIWNFYAIKAICSVYLIKAC
jgi:hypothetical protein